MYRSAGCGSKKKMTPPPRPTPHHVPRDLGNHGQKIICKTRAVHLNTNSGCEPYLERDTFSAVTSAQVRNSDAQNNQSWGTGG